MTGRQILFWTFIAALVILVIAPLLPHSFFPTYPAMQCEKYGGDHNQYCASLEVVRLALDRMGEFFEGFESLFLVVLTGVIAYFTFALREATVELRESTDRL